jgi:cytochrome c553
MKRSLSPGRGLGRGWFVALAATLFLSAFPARGQSPDRVKFCESCHGPGGNSVTPMIPSIAAQPPTFLENTLVYFREGMRNGQAMPAVAKSMNDEEITALAKHFSAQKATVVTSAPVDSALAARGRELAGKMHCGQCHMSRFQGQGQMARLAGQREDYLQDAMIGYRDGKRSAADTTMTEVLYAVGDADIRALAHFMSRAD